MHTAHVGLRSEASAPQLSPQQPNLLKLASSSCGKNVASPCPWSGAPPLACLLFLGRCFLPVQIHVVDFSLRRQTLHPPNPPLLSQPRSTHIVGISQRTYHSAWSTHSCLLSRLLLHTANLLKLKTPRPTSAATARQTTTPTATISTTTWQISFWFGYIVSLLNVRRLHMAATCFTCGNARQAQFSNTGRPISGT